MKKILFYLLSSTLIIFASCNKDDAKKIPVVTAPTESVAINDDVELSFEYTADAGFKTAVATALNGTATITTNGTAGAPSGTIVVTYTAGTTVGAATVSLTVTDNDGQTGTANATVDVKAGIPVSANITENTTWETGKVYILESRIAVVSGITLTIQPGTIVKGAAGSGENSTALLITRGAKLIAEGTANQPIIFTSVADNIVPGQIASPNLSADLDGFWGGLIVLGKARISVSGGNESKQIEGIPPSDANGLYGGTDDADNSGVIKYVSIRHGGSNIGEGNEINGLTLGGVGTGTVIENVEIVGNQDDGIEFFGGAVNVKNAIVWNAGDDALDTDQSYRGTVNNFIVITPYDKCFELDGPEKGKTVADRIDDKNHLFMNGSVKVGKAIGLVDNDGETNVDMNNIYFYGFDKGSKATFDELPTVYVGSAKECVFSNFEATFNAENPLKLVTDYFKGGSDAFTTEVTTPTVGADKTKFAATWSWAAAAGAY